MITEGTIKIPMAVRQLFSKNIDEYFKKKYVYIVLKYMLENDKIGSKDVLLPAYKNSSEYREMETSKRLSMNDNFLWSKYAVRRFVDRLLERLDKNGIDIKNLSYDIIKNYITFSNGKIKFIEQFNDYLEYSSDKIRMDRSFFPDVPDKMLYTGDLKKIDSMDLSDEEKEFVKSVALRNGIIQIHFINNAYSIKSMNKETLKPIYDEDEYGNKILDPIKTKAYVFQYGGINHVYFFMDVLTHIHEIDWDNILDWSIFKKTIMQVADHEYIHILQNTVPNLYYAFKMPFYSDASKGRRKKVIDKDSTYKYSYEEVIPQIVSMAHEYLNTYGKPTNNNIIELIRSHKDDFFDKIELYAGRKGKQKAITMLINTINHFYNNEVI